MILIFTVQRPPCSTLFPYTTLFRSDVGRLTLDAAEGLMDQDPRMGQGEALALGPGREQQRGDRKSTRLNSSHRCISYAVFCLKKKIESRRHTAEGGKGADRNWSHRP